MVNPVPSRSEGIVLRHINYGEADRIVTIYSADCGLRKGFAKSARNSRKRFGAALDPFTRAVFAWSRGRGDLWMLRDAEMMTSHQGLRTDLERLSLAGYGAELIDMLAGDSEDHQRIYDVIAGFLDYLDRGGDVAVARTLLELRLVYLLGYIPHLLHCSDCLKIFQDEEIRFDALRGGSLCLACAGTSTERVALGSVGSLARCLRVSHRQFDGFRFGQATIVDSRMILGQVLRQLLPREPKSLKLLEHSGSRDN